MRAYVVAAFLGALPGCLGSFLNVSLYMHGLIPFGALAGGMIAGSGDEAFVMLAMFPRQAVLLFGMLFALGLFAGKACDWWAGPFRIRPSPECPRQEYHAGREGLRHYLLEHVWRHIVVQHLWRVALWTFGALLLVDIGLSQWDLDQWMEQHHGSLLLLAGFTGLIPESGPHLVFVTLYARGHLPFSVLLASSIVQDGHGMLPLLSYSLRDAALIKLFNLMVGLALGVALRVAGCRVPGSTPGEAKHGKEVTDERGACRPGSQDR